MKNKIILDFGIPIVILACLTVLIGVTNADVSIMRLLYSHEAGWLYGQATIWKMLCDYGHYPALVIAAAGLVIFVLGFFKNALVKYRVIGLFLALYMIIGPGLIVNTVFKDHWGRPRPIDTQLFGGKDQFHQLWERGIPGNGRSFPSGQASTGFFFFAFYFLLRDRARENSHVFFLFCHCLRAANRRSTNGSRGSLPRRCSMGWRHGLPDGDIFILHAQCLLSRSFR